MDASSTRIHNASLSLINLLISESKREREVRKKDERQHRYCIHSAPKLPHTQTSYHHHPHTSTPLISHTSNPMHTHPTRATKCSTRSTPPSHTETSQSHNAHFTNITLISCNYSATVYIDLIYKMCSSISLSDTHVYLCNPSARWQSNP